MAGNQAIIIVILVCCFCVILPLVIYGSLWGTNTLCDKESSEKQEWIGIDCPSVYTGTAETPSPAEPTLPSGSIKLIDSETTFNSTNGDVSVANQPKATNGTALSYDLQPVQFTISFKINSTGTDNSYWREILQNSPGTSWLNNLPEASGNSPLFFIPPGTWEGQQVREVNKVTVRFFGSDGVGHQAESALPLVANQYHTITVVGDTNKLTIYIDGGNPVTTSLPGGNTLRYRNNGGLNEGNKFVWNPNPAPSGIVPWKIKDAYWWPRALTDAEVSTLVSTTSTYMPQPLSMGTSAYVKETYMPY
jgi:hypothetical protein